MKLLINDGVGSNSTFCPGFMMAKDPKKQKRTKKDVSAKCEIISHHIRKTDAPMEECITTVIPTGSKMDEKTIVGRDNIRSVLFKMFGL